MRFTILPPEGIEADGRRINIGASAEDITDVLGQPADILNDDSGLTRYFYFNNELRFDLDSNGRLSFVEFIGGTEGKLRPEIYGINAFEADADALLALLTENDSGASTEDGGYSYYFPNIQIGISRHATPEAIAKMKAEYIAEGEEISPGILAFEQNRASHWSMIGIGQSGYYGKKG
ncbi:hypothetical protein SAMN02910406_02492 [Ruminococcus albus]|uniref:EF-hand domain-containing protein n=2 Tax=Ruminococcus albus TaxID=1264 RepID=A0A1I1MFB3_RUMAL|nr:hypothetical protein SAMN02910406_02492 [Ruminococcus albus]